MNSLKNLFHKHNRLVENQSDPLWTSIFSPIEYDQFIQIVSTYFRDHKEEFSFDGESIILSNKNIKLGLQNLAQKCHQYKQTLWKEIVQGYFDGIDKINSKLITTNESLTNFSSISSRLAVRIWPTGTLEAIGRENCIYCEDLWDTVSVLVLDSPECINNVKPDTALLWEKSSETLFSIGLANVREQCKPDMYLKELENGIQVQVIASNNFFTTSYALFISEYPELIGIYGSLVCIPNRQVMVCYPIEGSQVLQAINQLMPIVDELYRNGPGSISPHLYWYYQNKYSPVTFDVIKKTIYIPPDFTEILNEIADKDPNLHP